MQPLVMIMHRNGKNALGVELADDIVIQHLADFHRRRNAIIRLHQSAFMLFANDIHAQFDAFVANEYRRSGNQFSHFVLAFTAEGAVQGVF